MKKFILILISIIFLGCSSSDNDENIIVNETLLDELKSVDLWHLDYSEYNLTSDYDRDGFMKFNEISSPQGILETWLSNPSQFFTSDCYRLFNELTIDDPTWINNWTIDMNTETELVLNNNNDREHGIYTFSKQNNVIILTYREYENGVQLQPGMPPMEMTQSNIIPDNDLTICD